MIRKIHLYLGTLFAPAIIFFAFSGILQTIGLHEAEKVAASQPPAWIVSLASLHKDQHLPQLKTRKSPAAIDAMRGERVPEAGDEAHSHEADDSASPAGAEAPVKLTQTILKAFVVLMASGLILSAILGIVIAYNNARTRRIAIIMFGLGLLIPVALVLR
ncbi:MAG: hypothetical protein H7234_07035 [Herminiimonas sp.]|nr:hypothetical protein [Herminiimonas sp.]